MCGLTVVRYRLGEGWLESSLEEKNWSGVS